MSQTAPLLGGSSGNGGVSGATFQGVSFDARPVRDNGFRICYLVIACLTLVSVGIGGATANFKGHKEYTDARDKWTSANDPWANNNDDDDSGSSSSSSTMSQHDANVFLGVLFAFVVGAFGAGFLWMRLLVAHARTMTWFSVGLMVTSMWLSALSLLAGGVFAGFVVQGIIAALVTAFVYWRRASIDLTAELLRNATRALLDHSSVVWANLGLILVSFFAFVIAVAGIYFATVTGDYHIDSVSLEPVWTPASYANGLIGVISIGFTFTSMVVTTLSIFLTAGVVSLWYFHRNDMNRMPAAPVSKVVSAGLGPQLGTIAFGALILWIVESIRDAERKAKESGQKNFGVICLLCLLSCIASWIEFFTTFAMINASITGAGFTDSAKTTFDMFKRSGLDMVTVDSFGSLVLNMTAFFCALFMGLGAGVLGHVMMDDPETWVVVVLGILVFVGAIIVFLPFIKMAIIAVDTCFTCYVIDIDTNRDDVGNAEIKAVLDEKVRGKK